MAEFSEHVTSIGTLSEPVRRELYLYVCAQPHAVSREEAAEAADIPLHKAKFHLDRLVAEGLLTTEFSRLSGRSGPGAGRPSKLYRRSAADISVSLPGREYELAGGLMADAIAESNASGTPILLALEEAARKRGHAMGETAIAADGSPRSTRKAIEIARRVLAEHGYEPREAGGRVELANCPFHALATTHTEMICGMNLALIDAMAETIDAKHLDSKLDPGPDRCCVVLTKRTSRQN